MKQSVAIPSHLVHALALALDGAAMDMRTMQSALAALRPHISRRRRSSRCPARQSHTGAAQAKRAKRARAGRRINRQRHGRAA